VFDLDECTLADSGHMSEGVEGQAVFLPQGADPPSYSGNECGLLVAGWRNIRGITLILGHFNFLFKHPRAENPHSAGCARPLWSSY
jgi:hypothetical protein